MHWISYNFHPLCFNFLHSYFHSQWIDVILPFPILKMKTTEWNPIFKSEWKVRRPDIEILSLLLLLTSKIICNDCVNVKEQSINAILNCFFVFEGQKVKRHITVRKAGRQAKLNTCDRPNYVLCMYLYIIWSHLPTNLNLKGMYESHV